ncbi:hypothetical protein RD792_014316 [Penstemon davidsonii]|uniref:PRONE domain-containing protein n=1 Tax=Penstemon davidsonii TaxID=160366 RepID=A0ABR0CP07_9LAMI|nr:hypothetical protein RD792_014316 [Penstemon davidsonii]
MGSVTSEEERRGSYNLTLMSASHRALVTMRMRLKETTRRVPQRFRLPPGVLQIEMMKERFAKLLLGEDMSGGGNGVCTALAISNAITNLSATVFGELWRLEPMASLKKAIWRREMEWLLSVGDSIVELVPSIQQSPSGGTYESFGTMIVGLLWMNVLRIHGRPSVRHEEKWWLPCPKVPSRGLSEESIKRLQQNRECTHQILKAALAINSNVLVEMEIPTAYVETLPKNGKDCLGDIIYRYITADQFSPESLLDCLDLSSEHHTLDVANRIEAAMHNQFLAQRAGNLLQSLRLRFPHLSQTALDVSKIQYNKDVGHSIIESYSRVMESLAYNIIARIDDVLYVDDAIKHNAAAEAMLVFNRAGGFKCDVPTPRSDVHPNTPSKDRPYYLICIDMSLPKFVLTPQVFLPTWIVRPGLWVTVTIPPALAVQVIHSARANATHNHGLDPDRLLVAEAFVGKGLFKKRVSYHARGMDKIIIYHRYGGDFTREMDLDVLNAARVRAITKVNLRCLVNFAMAKTNGIFDSDGPVKRKTTFPDKLFPSNFVTPVRGRIKRQIFSRLFQKLRNAIIRCVGMPEVIHSARANATHNHGLDPDRLLVAEAFVGKGLFKKRVSYLARGKSGIRVRAECRLTVDIPSLRLLTWHSTYA